MALSVNRVTLVGRLGAEPEVRQTPNGSDVANLSVATKKRWVDKAGAVQERTTWHKCVCWAQMAQMAAQILAKGSLVYLDGELVQSEYTDRDGNPRQRTEVRVDQFVAMESGKDRAAYGKGGPVRTPPVTVRDPGWETQDDAPF